ncbi:MAG TPA: xanthine dehydrogenase family protein subunit M [Alphaproteobacteria bacterium]|nr:xanthine dehydrogenase family protein subunit M [Alphaproteobacteria bacterium]
MYEFNYHRPKSLAEATNLLSSLSDPKVLAGGMTLIPTLKQRLASPSDLVDLQDIGELKGVKREGNEIVIGAMTQHWDVHTSPKVKSAIPTLAYLAGLIGDPSVRHRGTIGGSVANSDPAADYPSAVLGLGATVVTTKRKIAADHYFKGLFETALEPGEILTQIRFPVPEKAGYQKFANQASGYAMTGVFVAKFGNTIRVAVTGAGPCAFRVAAMEQALSKSFTPDAVAGITIPHDNLLSDIHGSAEYRAHLVTVMAKRAVASAK